MANKGVTDDERSKIIAAWLSNKYNTAKNIAVLTGISAGRCDAVITKYLNEKIKNKGL